MSIHTHTHTHVHTHTHTHTHTHAEAEAEREAEREVWVSSPAVRSSGFLSLDWILTQGLKTNGKKPTDAL